METTLQGDSQVRGRTTHPSLARGIGWGLVGGLVATLVMDLILMGALTAVGDQPLSCFIIVGDTVMHFFLLLGVETAGGAPLGVATHYIVGPVIGAIFGAAVTQIDALRAGTVKKRVVLAVVYVEVLSQPMLAMTPILLKMTALETLLWYGGSFVMHFICGIVLGLVVSYGLQAESIWRAPPLTSKEPGDSFPSFTDPHT